MGESRISLSVGEPRFIGISSFASFQKLLEQMLVPKTPPLSPACFLVSILMMFFDKRPTVNQQYSTWINCLYTIFISSSFSKVRICSVSCNKIRKKLDQHLTCLYGQS